MRQRCAKTLVTEEPDEGNLHVRTCGGAGWVTTGSTRNLVIGLFINCYEFGRLL